MSQTAFSFFILFKSYPLRKLKYKAAHRKAELRRAHPREQEDTEAIRTLKGAVGHR